MVFISIIIPIYNGIEFLEECINSVIAQTFLDWEILIGINGHGSDGGEVATIANHLATKDSRIKVIIQGPPLKGKVESLNHLTSLVHTDWICVLDCDDKWEPTKLERQVYTLYHEGKYASVIGTFCRYFGEKDGYPNIKHQEYVDPAVLELYNPIINSSSLIKKELCKWEYTELNYGVEDYYLWMEICLKGHRLYNIPEFLTWHRIHSTSAFNSKGYSDEPIRNRYKQLRNKL